MGRVSGLGRAGMMAYFVDGFDTSDRRAVLIWMRDSWDDYDTWGTAMGWLFDVAGEIAQRGNEVPYELHYRPGAFGPEVSEDNAEGLAEMSDDALQWAARVLNRYCECLKRAGLDY